MLACAGCRDKQDASSKAETKTVSDKTGAELLFPDALRVADDSVNQFVRTALTQCAKGKYEAFRALWSARRDPISRGEFEEGWHAVHRIEVKGLQKVLLESDPNAKASEPVYVLLVEVALDEAARVGQREPLREIVLMLVKEHDQWRLAAAPKEMRDWIKKQSLSQPVPGSPEFPSLKAP